MLFRFPFRSLLAILLAFSMIALHCKNANPGSSSSTPQPDTTSATISMQAELSASAGGFPITARLPGWPAREASDRTKLYPFDEAAKLPDFKAFRDTFYQAVVDKNVDYLLSRTSDHIKFSFGDDAHKEAFIKAWKLHRAPKSSQLWQELKTILELGGGFFENDSKRFIAPYLFVTEKIEDAFTEGAVLGKNVRLRAAADSGSEILESLTYDKVRLPVTSMAPVEETINGERHPWLKAVTAEGTEGYVYGKYIRIPIDFRAIFEQQNGRWMMVAFVAGD